MRVPKIEQSVEPLISFIGVRMRRLSDRQYRFVCAAIVVLGALGMYCGPGGRLLRGVVMKCGEGPATLYERRDEYRADLHAITVRLENYRREREEFERHAELPREDFVRTIDRASQQSLIRVEGVQAEGLAIADGRGVRHRYQVSICGDFPGIVRFIEGIVGEHSPIVITALDVRSPSWLYPVEQLETKLTLETR
jgi:hypothetical protein